MQSIESSPEQYINIRVVSLFPFGALILENIWITLITLMSK